MIVNFAQAKRHLGPALGLESRCDSWFQVLEWSLYQVSLEKEDGPFPS
jgi:hypothetical protein